MANIQRVPWNDYEILRYVLIDTSFLFNIDEVVTDSPLFISYLITACVGILGR